MSFTPLDCCSSSSFPACSLLCRSAGLEDPRGPDASTPRRDQVLAQRGKGALTDLVTAVCVCVHVCVCACVCVCLPLLLSVGIGTTSCQHTAPSVTVDIVHVFPALSLILHRSCERQ